MKQKTRALPFHFSLSLSATHLVLDISNYFLFLVKMQSAAMKPASAKQGQVINEDVVEEDVYEDYDDEDENIEDDEYYRDEEELRNFSSSDLVAKFHSRINLAPIDMSRSVATSVKQQEKKEENSRYAFLHLSYFL